MLDYYEWYHFSVLSSLGKLTYITLEDIHGRIGMVKREFDDLRKTQTVYVCSQSLVPSESKT